MTLYLSYTNAKAVGCSPGEDGCVDGAILTWLRAIGANFLAAFSVLVG